MPQQELQVIQTLNKMMRQLRQDFLYLLINNIRPIYQTPDKINDHYYFAFPENAVFAIILQASSKLADTPPDPQWLDSAEQHLRSCLTQMPGDAETLIYSNSKICCILGTTLPYQTAADKVCEIFRQIQSLPGMYTCNWTMGIGCCSSTIADVRESIFSAQHALKYSITQGVGNVYDGNDKYGIYEGGLTLLQSADELLLKRAIQGLHTDDVENCVQDLFHKRLEQIERYPVYAYMLSLQILQVSLQALRERMPIDRKTFELEQVYEAVIDEQLTLDALVSQTLSGTLKLCERYQQFTDQGHSRPIWLAVTYIQEHYTERITLDALANYADRNPQYLSAAFTKEFRMPVTEYIASLRIERAKDLLITTGMPISEIAARVGYQDAKYFSRIFQRQTGLSPRAFRQAVESNAQDSV